ncbi:MULTISPECIES: hypothetical protein [Halolamina]|uniref:Uncharacterized protein n=1 Tax=Halolamina pelagica TaxID=699431 RepID=A0A1I5RRC3_9EURY|nr:MULTISPECIES: hypothetical protein [Halolamina]NHX35306.1 hypothetical protein [Halolamina sp. R1-12]SFP61082.1 hypothetical protein SAMN05216277_105102 [Halolamina pelagica]
MRSRRVLLAAVLVAAALAGTAAVGSSTAEPSVPPADQLVSPAGTESYVWPYTSRRQSTAGRTLALNVVVYGGPDRVRRAFVDRSGTNWTVAGQNATVGASPWRPAHGSVRYSYVTPDRGGTGRWIAPEYQLAVGAYFGDRTHIRAYPGPSGNWTALQAHTEYWDWFRLRHTVTGVEPGAAFVGRDLKDEPFVEAIDRRTHGQLGGGSDGTWITVEFAAATLLGAAVPLTRGRLSRRDVALPVAILGVVLGVRAWGLAAEAVAPGVNPKLYVAVGYPVLVVGPPALASVLARDRPPVPAALLAFAGLAVAAGVDLAVVGVDPVPTHVLQHRLALAAALGVIAFGAARTDRRVLGLGVVAWIAALAAPLVGVV